MGSKKYMFASIDPVRVDNLPDDSQRCRPGEAWVRWGRNNRYPQYLFELYEQCPTLQAIINGNVNFCLGEAVEGIDIETISHILTDYYIFGVASAIVTHQPSGHSVVEWVDSRYIRLSEDEETCYISEAWYNHGRVQSEDITHILPVNDTEALITALIIKNPRGRTVYSAPIWSGALKSVVTETKIAEYHLAEITNGFASPTLINFNNGVPDDNVQREIEESIVEKFTGESNAGRFILNFNDSMQNRTTIEQLGGNGIEERYKELAERTREQIFVAFSAQPLLFGLTSTSNTGFSTEEFNNLFTLYNKVMIAPIQRQLSEAFATCGIIINIQPFTQL